MSEWSTYDPTGFQAVSAGGATILSGIAFEDPGTIIRTRGSISVFPSVFSADINIVGAFGIGLVSAEAFAAGVASVPEPFTDSDWGGWMVIQPFALRFEFQDATGTMQGSWTFDIDSKAQRKVEPNSVMVVVAESITGAFNIADTTRLLQLLH